MATCEMCGITTTSLGVVKTAGTNMKVCANCSNMGQSMEKKVTNSHSFYKNVRKEDVSYEVISNYQSLISSSLAKKNLTPHHLALNLNLKESTLNKILTGKFVPEVTIAKRIENFLGIKLVVESISSLKVQDVDDNKEVVDEKPLNLADLIMEKLRGKK